LAGVVIAVVYFFNPMTISQITDYDNYLTVMVLIPALAAAVVAYGNNRIRLWQICVAFAVSAPFVGYVYTNPPLVAMLAVTTIATPLLVWSRFGRDAAGRSVFGLLIAGALLLGASAYWIIPSLITSSSISSGSLSTLSAWAFTETRSTLSNGLWLNTTWGWNYPQYYPYAGNFSHLPLELVRPLLPLIAFGGLALRRVSRNFEIGISRMRGLLSIVALGVIFLSTGTRPPGNLLFDVLYHLPYGWLLREPGRFLIVAALGYALLSGLLVEQIQRVSTRKFANFTLIFRQRTLKLSSFMLVAFAILIVALAAGFPLWTGQVILGPRDGFPSDHVVIPKDWSTTARYLNSSSSPRGSLLVLPPDDFYAMPYTWYYGNDAFIPNLFSRLVVVPNAQTYFKNSAELLQAVKLEAAALLNHDWDEAGRLLTAIGTPIVLVRGDIDALFPGRSIVSPLALAANLSRDPEMKLIHRSGTLSLYELRDNYRPSSTEFATVASSSPDLRDLTLIPRNAVLVTSVPKKGHVALFPIPPITDWNLSPTSLSTQLTLPAGWKYFIESTSSGYIQKTKSSLLRTAGGGTIAHIRVPVGTSLISNGDFSAGDWGAVENCSQFVPVKPPQFLRATTIAHVAPGGASALQLTATVDSSCESKTLSWHGGPFLLRLWERTLVGAPARLCIFEEPAGTCAAAPTISSGTGWQRYSTIVDPTPGTTSITIFLYADSSGVGQTSVEQYAEISANSLSQATNIVAVGTPVTRAKPSRLITSKTGYSPQWVGSPGSTHVLVDGMRNGWIASPKAASHFVTIDVATSHESIDEALLATVMVIFAAALWWLDRYRRRDTLLKPTDLE
jgi:hypothetical protein